MVYGWLHIQYSSGRSEDVEITKSPLMIGRATDNDVVLNDTAVASYHLCLTATATGCQITDLHSQSGSFLNDQPLVPDQAYPLEPGNTLRCGNIRLQFTADDIQTGAQPAPHTVTSEQHSNALGAVALGAALPAAAAAVVATTNAAQGMGNAIGSVAASTPVQASVKPDGAGGPANQQRPNAPTNSGSRGTDRPTRPLFTRTPVTPATDATKPLSTPPAAATGSTVPLPTDGTGASGLEERLSALPPGMPGMLQRRQTKRLEDVVLSPPPPTLSESIFDQPPPRQRDTNASRRRRPEPQPVVPYDESAPPTPIRIDLPAINPSVQPGKSVVLPVTLVNRSRLVERIELRVMGLPTGWARVTPDSVSLFPGEQGQAEIEITPPNDHTSLAGPHHFQVVAFPQQRPADRVTENKIVNVLPFHQFVLEMEHLQQTALRRGEYDFQVINTGNVALPLYWEGSNEENALGFQFTPTGANLEPGAKATAKARITLRGVRWLGKGNTYPFSIRARSTEDQNMMEQLGGRLVHRPLRLRMITFSVFIPLLVVACVLLGMYLVPKAKGAVTDVRTWVVERADAITGSNNAGRTATAAADNGAVGTPSAAEGTPELDGTALAALEMAASQATAQAAGTAAASTAGVAATVVIPTLIPTAAPTVQLAPTPISVAQILQTFLPSTPTSPPVVVPAGNEGAGSTNGSAGGAATGPTTTPNRLTATAAAGTAAAVRAAASAAAGPQTSVLVTPNTSQVCPTTFNFSAIITLEGPGTVIYQWERSDGTYSPEQTLVFTRAGSQIVTTIWQVNVSMIGWMRVRPLTANAAVSNQATFTLACPPAPTNILTEVGPSTRALCLATFRFTSTLAMEAPGVVSYKWERSDGSLSATKLVTFTSAGLQTVTDTWRLQLPPGLTFNGWGRVRTVGIDPVVSNQAPFTMLCPALATFGPGGSDPSGINGPTPTPGGSGGTVQTPTRTPTNVGTTAPVTGTATMTPTPTPIPKVTRVMGSVKNGSVAVCPGTFFLDGEITLDRAGVVEYRWESNDGKQTSPTFSLTFSGAGTLPTPSYSWTMPGSTPLNYGVFLRTLTPNPLASGLVPLTLSCKVAYIYSGDLAARDEYKSLLNSRGISVTLVSITNTARTDFTPYQTILIGYDTGSADQWGSISSVVTVTRGLKPIVGIGSGGHAFFGKLQLAIGWSLRPYSYSRWLDVYPHSTSDNVWFNPYALSLTTKRIPLYSELVTAVGPYERSISDSGVQGEGVVAIGDDSDANNAGARTFFVVSQRKSSSSQLNTLWGFEGPPSLMTAAGKDLFMNIVLKR